MRIISVFALFVLHLDQLRSFSLYVVRTISLRIFKEREKPQSCLIQIFCLRYICKYNIGANLISPARLGYDPAR